MLQLFFLFLFVVVCLIIAKSIQSPGESANSTEIVINYLDEVARSPSPGYNIMHTNIAGISYHCGTSDCGKFSGIVAHEPTNTKDPDAVAIYRSDGKLLGYVKVDEQSTFNDLNNGSPCPCFGYIRKTDEYIYGSIIIARPSNREFVQNVFNDFERWNDEKRSERG